MVPSIAKLFARALAVLLLLNSTAALAIAITIAPASQTVVVGAPFAVDLRVTGLGNGVALGGFDLIVDFDATRIAFTDATFGNQIDLSGLGDLQSVTRSAGRVELFEVSLDPAADLGAGQAPAFRLATLSFTALAAAASSALTLSLNTLVDANGAALTATLSGATLTISAVDNSPSAVLLACGLALLGVTTARRQQRRR